MVTSTVPTVELNLASNNEFNLESLVFTMSTPVPQVECILDNDLFGYTYSFYRAVIMLRARSFDMVVDGCAQLRLVCSFFICRSSEHRRRCRQSISFAILQPPNILSCPAAFFIDLPSFQATDPSLLSIHSRLSHSHSLFLSDDDNGDVSDSAKSGWWLVG